MHICVEDIEFASVYTIFRLDFGALPAAWYLIWFHLVMATYIKFLMMHSGLT